MNSLFFKLEAGLQASLDALSALESEAIRRNELKMINDLFMIHKKLYDVLESVEKQSASFKIQTCKKPIIQSE